MIAPKIAEIVAAMVGCAVGVKAARTLENGEELVYTTLPDCKTGAYLLDRAAGKPRQAAALELGPIDIRAAVEATDAASAAYTDPDDDDGPNDDLGA